MGLDTKSKKYLIPYITPQPTPPPAEVFAFFDDVFRVEPTPAPAAAID
jgi:hypothetical protein